MIYGVILAGGKGERMENTETPKQYLKIGNKPILIYSIEQFYRNEKIDKIIVLCPKQYITHTKEIVEKYLKAENIAIIEGGELRNDTIIKAIDYIEKNLGLTANDILVTHDAVRPFVSQEIINNNIEAMKTAEACDTAIPATDTIVESQNGLQISNILNRNKLYHGQTPQTFRAKIFKDLYTTLADEEKITLTDAIKVLTLKGIDVVLVKGSTTNIKITYPIDIEISKSLLEGNYFEK